MNFESWMTNVTLSSTLRDRLRDKAERLLWTSAIPGRTTFVEQFLEPALTCGNVGLIGGAVRDLAFQSVRKFKSDLDFVLCVDDFDAFARLSSTLNLRCNAFGGYRTTVGGLRVDFWEARSSWAHLAGHCQVNDLSDVRKTTFFNLDAIILDVGKRELIADEEVISGFLERYLDINLRPNPNEDGAAVRALRRLWKNQLKASKRLVDFLVERVDASGWEALIERDSLAFPHAPILVGLFQDYRPTANQLKNDFRRAGGRLPPGLQYELEFTSRTPGVQSSSATADIAA
ncbi:MAG: hypothetical protein ABJL57_02530 [Hyphomonas sp.]|uniref:hypothetical protein n=2 Tax=Pseudomonadota TaxID=1224 RepID=UPI0032981779